MCPEIVAHLHRLVWGDVVVPRQLELFERRATPISCVHREYQSSVVTKGRIVHHVADARLASIRLDIICRLGENLLHPGIEICHPYIIPSTCTETVRPTLQHILLHRVASLLHTRHLLVELRIERIFRTISIKRGWQIGITQIVNVTFCHRQPAVESIDHPHRRRPCIHEVEGIGLILRIKCRAIILGIVPHLVATEYATCREPHCGDVGGPDAIFVGMCPHIANGACQIE